MRRAGECVVIDTGPLVEYFLFERIGAHGADPSGFQFQAIRTAVDHQAMTEILDRHPGRLVTGSGVIVEINRVLRALRDQDTRLQAWDATCLDFCEGTIEERWIPVRQLHAADPVLLRDLGPVDASLVKLATICLSEHESAFVLTSDGPLIRACRERGVSALRVSDVPPS